MSTLSEKFAALGDPTRFEILQSLMTQGETSAGDIVAASSVSAPAISRHLGVLHDAGLILRRAQAQRRLYSVNPAAMGEIARWTMSHRDFWEASLGRLDAIIQKQE